jgi:hypothetical protein
MSDIALLKDLLHKPDMSRKDQILLCLSCRPVKTRSVSEIKDIAVQAGLRNAKTWNLSQILGSLSGEVIRGPEGWELTSAGVAKAEKLRGGTRSAVVGPVSHLREMLPDIADKDTVEFLKEAIACFESGHYRAAVVLSWVGAVSVLYAHVVTGHLHAFNAEALRRDSKWRAAKTSDDLARMGEYDFLQVLEAVSLIGKSVKLELEGCLKLRNGCGHPNSLKIKDHRAASHLEMLILNVFVPFA